MRIFALRGTVLALLTSSALGPTVAAADVGRQIVATNVPTIDVGESNLAPKKTMAQDNPTPVTQDSKPTRKPESKDPTPTKSDPKPNPKSDSKPESDTSVESKSESTAEPKSESLEESKQPAPTEPPKPNGQSMIACVVENSCGSDTKCVTRCSAYPDPDVSLVQRTAGCLGRCNSTEIGAGSMASCYQKCIDGIFVDYPVSTPKLMNVQSMGPQESNDSYTSPSMAMLSFALYSFMMYLW